MIKIRGILFDKDGTLLDFKAMWLPVMGELAAGLIAEYGLSAPCGEALLASIGVFQREIDGRGLFATGTGEQVGEALYDCLLELGIKAGVREEFAQQVTLNVNALAEKYRERIFPIGNLAETIGELKNRGFYLGISTSDTKRSTLLCLERLGVLEYFDFLGTDDGVRQHKPHGDLLHAFCQEFSLQPDEVAIVGDTQVDLQFAKNNGAGLAVGVLSGLGTWEALAPLADLVLPDVNALLRVDYFSGRGLE